MLVERRVASVTGFSLGLLCNPAGVAGVTVTVQGKAISLDRRQRPAGNTPSSQPAVMIKYSVLCM